MKQAFIALELLEGNESVVSEGDEKMIDAEKKISKAFSAIDQAVRFHFVCKTHQ